MSLKQSEKLLLELKKETDIIIKTYQKYVKAVWIITPDEILSNDDLTIMVLIDDAVANASMIKKIDLETHKEEQKIRKETSFKIHSGIYLLSEYFEKVMEGDIEIFREINSSIPIYDPTGFFKPLKSLVEKGNVLGSSAALENLKKNVEERLKRIKAWKVEIIEKLSSCVINAGQAPLIADNHRVPHPRRVDEELIKWFGKTGKLPKHYAKLVEEVFEYYKGVEHGTIKEITGLDIDMLFKKANNVFDKMESFVSTITK